MPSHATDSDLARQFIHDWVSSDKNRLKKWCFHGSGEPFPAANLAATSHGNILWTTTSPTLAQSYIPVAGGRILAGCYAMDFNKQIRPDIQPDGTPQGWYRYAIDAGFEPVTDIKLDNIGRVDSYRSRSQLPTYGEIAQYLGRLGYHPDRYGNFNHWLKEHHCQIMPNDWRLPGRLFIIRQPDDIRNQSIATGESDLTEIQYHQYDHFKRCQIEGYDCVDIDDFAQVDDWGNVGHQTRGFFPKSIEKLDWFHIDAIHPTIDGKTMDRWSTTPELTKFTTAHSCADA